MVEQTLKATGYPLPAFYFKVIIAGILGDDTSFQEVRGIGSELDTEEVAEGGENRFVHRRSKIIKHPELELKRGIAELNSPLVGWCRSVLESDFSSPIAAKTISVYLCDQDGGPIQGWSFANAYPVKWEIGDYNSTKKEVAIATLILSYTSSNRLI